MSQSSPESYDSDYDHGNTDNEPINKRTTLNSSKAKQPLVSPENAKKTNSNDREKKKENDKKENDLSQKNNSHKIIINRMGSSGTGRRGRPPKNIITNKIS